MTDATDLREVVRSAHERSAELRRRSEEVLAAAEATVERLRRGEYVPRTSALLEEIAGLRQALESRGVIEQAKGIIIARTGCTAESAFAILVRQSQHENRKLRDVAEQLVHTAVKSDLRPADPQPPRVKGPGRRAG